MKQIKMILTVGMLCCFTMSIIACSNDKLPDNAKDIVSMAYKNMSDIENFSMRSQLNLDMNLSGNDKIIEAVTTAAKKEDPYEILIANMITTNGEASEPTYHYGYEKDNTMYLYNYKGGAWKTVSASADEVEALKDQYVTPVSFRLYLVGTDSFQIVEQSETETVLEGAVTRDNIVSVLEETGVLKQLSLTSCPENMLSEDASIKVRVWIDNETVMIKRMEADMKDIFQGLTTVLFGKDSIVSPEIKRCIITIDEIALEDITPVELPKEVQTGLDQIKG